MDIDGDHDKFKKERLPGLQEKNQQRADKKATLGDLKKYQSDPTAKKSVEQKPENAPKPSR